MLVLGTVVATLNSGFAISAETDSVTNYILMVEMRA